ncbi:MULTISPECIES: dGTP triphosphohydrolase [unclassified Lentimonas]|uniref:dGTP triphosphohydrolase n=1 Tax=unclassified Lentimonas TaxID=2630993 RepID=UPI001320BE75|nr:MULTISPECIES: dNTP triphosphohydrolase [unclassified Lentimonas]CAA6690053.1 dNTP triphosphohydrolase, putative [Lentimonas sp. CC19]CAA6691025.1 dNTP triphosphohydrolase, putative [Lentimonas sp. CC10]CAA7070665.1 dNTP triphosphohydrolase, putative [Lentimonas sp. CC11]
MKNKFYNAFDLERFPDTPVADSDYRNAFQIERDRIIFSYPFRRLQSKTQVFQSGEYDFYRTRLTHSIEVAKIGRSICEYLRASSDQLNDRFYIDADLTEAVGLAHDMGHPPFGHIGERKLNELMHEHGGFEGNGQTLRILTELIYERPGATKGIAPTRAFLDGVMKYKALHHECIGQKADGSPDYPEHHFIYDEQANWRSTIFGGNEIPAELNNPKALNSFKSIECQIMDWADDTAYSLNDIVDGIHARYINVGSITEWAATQDLNADETALIEKLCQVIREDRYESHFGARIGRFVHGCTLTPRSGFLSDRTNRHAFDLTIAADVKAESKLYKRIALDLIFRSPQLQQIEFKGGHILEKLFRALCEHCGNDDGHGLRILPVQVQELLKHETTTAGRHRRLCDFTAGLTDSLAVRTYKRLYDPDFGSIAELL